MVEVGRLTVRLRPQRLALGTLIALEKTESGPNREDDVFVRADRRRMMLALVIAIAVATVAIPTWQMVACSMDMSGGMMRVFPTSGASIRAACDGTWLANNSPLGVTSEFSAMTLALMAAFAGAIVLFAPQLSARPVRVAQANAPPPPLDPRGERFLL
jgi:hypothetical protein